MATMVEISVESLVTLGFVGGGAFFALMVFGVKAAIGWLDTDFDVRRLSEENEVLKAKLRAAEDKAFNYKLALIEAGVKVA